jgi:sensor histidine kinase YesM
MFMDIALNLSIADSLVYNTLYCLLGLGLWYPTRYISVDEKRIWKTLLNHLFAAVFSSVIWAYAGYFILSNWFSEYHEYVNFLDNSFSLRITFGVIFYLVTVSFYYIIFYYKRFKEKAEHESKMETLLKESELRSLKYQINPHFIFNSLNSISSLTMSEPKVAQEMTINLSSFLRSTLSHNDRQMNLLKDEIENIKLYLEIEKIRFGENLDFDIDINKECKSTEVPSMILQPLIENAIKHGVYESIEKITINLACKREKDYLVIQVKNNFDPDTAPRKGKGIGLKNIQERLKLIYNQDNLLTYEKSDNQFTAKIYIPKEK